MDEKTEKQVKEVMAKPKPKPQPPKETQIADKLDPAMTKTLKRVGVVTVEQLNELSDSQILEIPGIGGTRLERLFMAIGRKPEEPEEAK